MVQTGVDEHYSTNSVRKISIKYYFSTRAFEAAAPIDLLSFNFSGIEAFEPHGWDGYKCIYAHYFIYRDSVRITGSCLGIP
jgi:hypothetical protein